MGVRLVGEGDKEHGARAWSCAAPVGTLSEEISSRVAECTRLILVKEGFGGDLGALSRCADERRKNTRILEWFGPPERNTLRPLGSCINCVCLGAT
jgi:hypothetical protein